MKDKKKLYLLFEKLRPIILAKLLSREVLESPRGQTFFYDGEDTDEESWTSPVAQLMVPLNDEEAEILSPDEFFTAQSSNYHNVWYVYPDIELHHPWTGWHENVVITLKTYDRQNYLLCISLVCNGAHHVAAYKQVMVSGSIQHIAQTVKSDKFPRDASIVFNVCVEAVALDIQKSERQNREAQLFADTDIADYDSVMKFVDSVKPRTLLKSKGHGFEVFRYDGVVSLIDSSSKKVRVLVDRVGSAQFCRIEDFPDELLNMIRRERSNWNLEVYSLSVGKFNDAGLSYVTWVISPYYYCPMDEDGFGEEEEYEVAVTCHINTEGRLADTPVWKPYTGPRR